MKPITPRDVYRFAENQIEDEAECLRISAAIAQDEQLGRLFDMLVDDADEADELAAASADRQGTRERMGLLQRSRLWPVMGNPFRSLHASPHGERISLATGDPRSSPFIVLTRQGKSSTRFEFTVTGLPADCRVLNVSLARFGLRTEPSGTRTLRPVTTSWKERRLLAQPGRATNLACSPTEETRTLALQGVADVSDEDGVIDLSLDSAPGTVWLRYIESPQLVEPVVIEAWQGERRLAVEAVLLSAPHRGQEVPAFATITEPIGHITARPLGCEDLSLLNSEQVSLLLADKPATLVVVDEVAGKYQLELTPEEATFAAEPGVTVCLTVASTQTGVLQ